MQFVFGVLEIEVVVSVVVVVTVFVSGWLAGWLDVAVQALRQRTRPHCNIKNKHTISGFSHFKAFIGKL